MFHYDPMSEDECIKNKGFPRLDDGIYTFKVIEKSFKMSDSGNPTINLTLSTLHDGKEYKVWDMLIGTKNMEWKTKHFCESAGLEERYAAKAFNENCISIGMEVEALVGFQAERPNPKGGVYKARNVIEDYVGHSMKMSMGQTSFTAPSASQPNGFDTQDIPF